MTSDNILVMLTPAEVNIVRQSLRAERDRMVRQGFAGLAKLAEETSSKVSDAMLDRKISIG
jgi:hypothetical protein